MLMTCSLILNGGWFRLPWMWLRLLVGRLRRPVSGVPMAFSGSALATF